MNVSSKRMNVKSKHISIKKKYLNEASKQSIMENKHIDTAS